MKFSLKSPVYTIAVFAAFQEVMKNLAAAGRLQHEWLTEVVQTNLKFGEKPEQGIVVYPCRRGLWNKTLVPHRERRIVLKPLPSTGKVKATFLEIAFGTGLVNDPLLGTSDCPVKKMLGGDGKYLKDFFLIIDSLKEILVAKNSPVFSAEQNMVEQIAAQ